MKASLVTLHRVFNYGSVLQAYATQRIFEEAGCEVEIVDYVTEQRTTRRLLLGKGRFFRLKNAKRIVRLPFKTISFLIKKRKFGKFLDKNCNLTKRKYVRYEDIINDPPQADIYITGSDQVWNSQYNEGVDKGFFLEYAPNNKRCVAFVSSFGKKKLDADERDITVKYLKKYSSLSVREDSAAEILKDLGYSSECLIDPTLQIHQAEWKKIASPRLIKEKYLILMLLYNEDNGATDYARRIADEKGLKLVKISWEFKKNKKVDKLMTHRTPQDFLSLFANADFVVTNSFHGMAFSINFNRDFIVVPRKEFNSRLESLLRLTGLESRMVFSEDMAIKASEKSIDYSSVNRVLDMERERAKKFVENSIK